ncbi:MAG: VOC family protein [Anaerolineae bacterium]
MELGQFSLSLAVKDIKASRSFYEKLGFTALDGKPDEGWIIMHNNGVVIGLFQGMFEKNMLTFNPRDVRAVQAELKAAGVHLMKAAAEGEGPAHATLVDPDGNPILLDQHPEDHESQPPQ